MHIAIIIPCYNEEKRLMVGRFLSYLSRNKMVKFLFVNDGSTDSTCEKLEIIKSQCTRTEQVECIHLKKNMGKGEAVRIGMLNALKENYSFVGYWDADLSTPLEAIDDFVKILDDNKGKKIVIGSRVKLIHNSIHRNILRHCAGRLFASVAFVLTNINVYDTQCGAKLLRVDKITISIFSYRFVSRWIFDLEILLRLTDINTECSNSIYEHPLSEWKDVKGSHISPLEFPFILIDIFKIIFFYKLLSRRIPSYDSVGCHSSTPKSL